MLDQAWRWINLWKLLLRYTDNRAVMIEDHCPRTGSALIQGKHILCHGCLLSSSKYIRLYKTTTYRIGTGSGACAGNKNKKDISSTQAPVTVQVRTLQKKNCYSHSSGRLTATPDAPERSTAFTC